jgi:hypothetical protein
MNDLDQVTIMLSKINWELLGALTALFICVTMLFATPQKEGKLYDCRLAEISPDYPIKVKEECRKLNTKQAQ